jgi:cytoskeleton protein RodZ
MSDQQHIPAMPSSHDELRPQSEVMPAPLPLPGTVMAAARQARGWSIEYVASHLKLATRQIHALEEDRYEALPSPVVIRGFIRIYAKMLGIDSAELIAALPADPVPVDAQVRPSRTLSTPFSESSLPLRGQHELPLAKLLWLAFGVLVIAGLFAGMKYGNWNSVRNSSLLQRLHLGGGAVSTSSAAAANIPNADNPEPSSAPAVVADSDNAVPSNAVSTVPAPAASVSAAPAAAAAPAPAVSAVVNTTTPIAPTAPVVAAAPATSTTPPAQESATSPTPATPAVLANPLQLKITQDSWIEIRRGDKSIVVSRIMKAGTTEAFDVSGPMSMTVGNAAGVNATLRGKPLELAASTSSNVARLDLK